MPIEDHELLDFLPLYPEETEDVVRARWSAWANEGLGPDDPNWVDVRPGSHFQINTDPGVREAARLYDFAGTEVVASGTALWSWGEYMDDHAEQANLERLAATAATGSLTFIAPVGTGIASGTTVATDPGDPDEDGVEFETTESGVIAAVIGAPVNLSGTPSSAGGSLDDAAYFYRVTALNAEGETDPSAEESVTVAGGTGNGSVDLTWDAVGGVSGYRVYRASVSEGIYGLIGEVSAAAFTDTDATIPGALPPSEDMTGGRITLAAEAVEDGTAGNVATGAVAVPRTPVTGLEEVFNPSGMTGGTDPETDEALLKRIRRTFVSKVAGNQRYYEEIALAQPGVGRATVIPVANGPGTVTVIILTADGGPVSIAVIDALQELLDPSPGTGDGLAPVDAEVTVLTGVLEAVDVHANVEPESDYSLDGTGSTVILRGSIEEAIASYLNSIEPGGEVVLQQVTARIALVSGVHDVGGVQLNGAGVNVTLDDDPPGVAEPGTIELNQATL